MPLQSLLDESAKPTYASIGAIAWARRRHSVPIGAVGAVDSLSNEVECSAGTWFTLLKITWDLQTDKCYCSGGDRLSSSLQPSSQLRRLTSFTVWTPSCFCSWGLKGSLASLTLISHFWITVSATHCQGWAATSGGNKKGNPSISDWSTFWFCRV